LTAFAYADAAHDLLQDVGLNNVAGVRKDIAKGANVGVEDANGEAVLLLAVELGDSGLPVVEALVKAGADVNTMGISKIIGYYTIGWTPLLLALQLPNNLPTVRYLLESGADVKARNNYRGNALMAACAAPNNGNLELVKMLVKAGSDVDAIDVSVGTALMVAEQYRDNLAVINYLIAEAGADANKKNKDGDSALSLVAGRGDSPTVAALIAGKADVNAANKSGNTPLMIAAASGDAGASVVKSLIEAGADVNAKNKFGDTALMMAATMGSLGAAKALVESGADVAAQPKENKGWTALMFALDNHHLEVVTYLREVMDRQRDSGGASGSGNKDTQKAAPDTQETCHATDAAWGSNGCGAPNSHCPADQLELVCNVAQVCGGCPKFRCVADSSCAPASSR
jgi:ankyrin repeat protein